MVAVRNLDVWGNQALLGRPAVGVCGARNADERAIEMAGRFGRFVAKLGLVLVSGNARGVDDAAQFGALKQGGAVISVLPEGLEGWRPRARYRDLITDENYAAASEFPPDARWQTWRAMQRNRTILDLSCALVVVQSGVTGGTWEAGLECLRQGKPLLVVQRQQQPATEGNARLIARGGVAVPSERMLVDLLSQLSFGETLVSGQQPLL